MLKTAASQRDSGFVIDRRDIHTPGLMTTITPRIASWILHFCNSVFTIYPQPTSCGLLIAQRVYVMEPTGIKSLSFPIWRRETGPSSLNPKLLATK